MLPALRFPALSMGSYFARHCDRSSKIPGNRTVVASFISMFFNSNTIFVGSPINQAPLETPAFLCFDDYVIRPFSTLGTYLIHGMVREKRVWSQNESESLSSAPDGLSGAGVTAVMLQIKLPAFLASDLVVSGQFNDALVQIFIGLSVSHVGVKQLILGKDQLLILTRVAWLFLSLDGFRRLLDASSKPDEASFYHPVRYACDDQCASCYTLTER